MPLSSKPCLLFLLALAAFAVLLPTNDALAQAQAGEKLVVEADGGLEWKRRERLYIATGNATATHGDVILMAGRIEARYRENGGESGGSGIDITEIAGIGGSVLQKGGLTARASRIGYDILSDRAVLSGGNPTVTTTEGSITAAESINYDRKEQEIEANGEVVVNLRGGRSLRAQRIVATMNETDDGFTFIRASGNAEVLSADTGRRASADEIEYAKETSVVVLSGSVTIFEGSNSLTGERGEINLETGASSLISDSGRVIGVFSPSR